MRRNGENINDVVFYREYKKVEILNEIFRIDIGKLLGFFLSLSEVVRNEFVMKDIGGRREVVYRSILKSWRRRRDRC